MTRSVRLAVVAALGSACTGGGAGPSVDSTAPSTPTSAAASIFAVPATTVDPDPTTNPHRPDAVVADPREASRVVEHLENVADNVLALGSVWAVTSNRSDEFSPGDVRATVVRIDPVSGRVDRVVASSGIEPHIVEAGGRLWVTMVDRVVALDPQGVEVGRVRLELGRADGLTTAGGLLWVVVNADDQLVGIDPASAEVLHTIGTGEFPVSPVSAFGSVWVPSLIDGTITIVDAAAGPEPRVVTQYVSENLESVMPITGGAHGDEVWVTNVAGEVYAVSADPDRLGRVRRVAVDRSINRVVVHGDTAFLLPTWGKSVLAVDVNTDAVLAEIPIHSIPIRALTAHDLIWVTSDGDQETLTVIDPETLTVRARFRVGSNESTTTGPRQPLSVGDEIWVPNRGDDAFFIVDVDDL